MASTVNLDVIGIVPGITPDPLWRQTAGSWLRDMGIMAGLAVVRLVITWI